MTPSAPDSLRRFLRGGSYGIVTVPGDPFYRAARARLIWANNTAQANANLGVPTMLAADVTTLPIRFESAGGMASLRRLIGATYNLPVTYELRGTHDLPARFGTMRPGQWSADYGLARIVFPYCGVMHTRHPLVLAKALRLGLTCIYEDHDETHNTADQSLPQLAAEHPNLRVIVAITEAVRDRLLAAGIPAERVIVLGSACNRRSLERQDEEALRIRRNLVRGSIRHLVVYSGGLQEERGIADIIDAAAAMTDTAFVLLGGDARHQLLWRGAVQERGLSNVTIVGYLAQRSATAFQQAADAVLMTRRSDERAPITSPLKFFEYLAAGSPICMAELPALKPFLAEGLVAASYDPDHPETMVAALRGLLTEHAWRPEGHARNREIAERHTWEARQLALFERLCAPSRAATPMTAAHA